MKIVIEDGLWESDFLLKDILPKGEVNFVSTNNIEDINEIVDVYAFSSRVHSYWNIRDTVKKIQPKIIIQLSDEFYQENKWEYNLLGNYCKLFLRNYHHPYYNYTPNTLHIPLGYTSGCKVFDNKREYNWTFIGELKSDRMDMLNVFSNLENYYINNKISKEEMCSVYSKSIFVPCGRGNSSLECFRLYEASMNGAIPIVVGDPKEIKSTFKYENNPPWIFSDSWESAFDTCRSLLNNTNQLKEQQKNVLNWWNTRIDGIKSKVLEVL